MNTDVGEKKRPGVFVSFQYGFISAVHDGTVQQQQQPAPEQLELETGLPAAGQTPVQTGPGLAQEPRALHWGGVRRGSQPAHWCGVRGSKR